MCQATISRANYGHRCYRAHDLSNPFRNANNGQYNAHLKETSPAQGGLQLSPEALGFLKLASTAALLQGGPFGMLMGMFGSLLGGLMNGLGAGQHPMAMENPGFGDKTRRADSSRTRKIPMSQDASAPKVAPGQTKELKEGETVRGANGTLLTWGQGDKVDVKYKDKNGQTKTISVKDGMISFDGGAPKKLENTGQLLKLPNGDVIGLGNQNSANGGKDLCRVVMADNTDKVACSPPSATNIYDVEELERRYTSMEGGRISMNVTSASIPTPYGMANFASANIDVFLGHPVTRAYSEQLMRLTGAK